MRLSNLLRLPGKSCPDEILTGDATLDAYLQELDLRLLGSKDVRLLTLSEISDHLQEKKASLIGNGTDETTAAEEAVRTMGAIEEHASAQRSTLRAKFIRIAAATGIPFGIFMGLFSCIMVVFPHIADWNVISSLLVGVFSGVFFGLFGGLIYAFISPERLIAAQKESIKSVEMEFEVTFSKAVRHLSFFCLVVFLLMTVTCLVGGIAVVLYPGVQEQIRIPWWVAFGFCALSLLDTFFVAVAFRAFLVDANGFWIIGWSGVKQRVSWNDIKTIGVLGQKHTWIPRWSAWRRVKFIEFDSGHKRQRRAFVYREVENAERFLQLLGTKIDGRVDKLTHHQ